jgi:hypothetical protein
MYCELNFDANNKLLYYIYFQEKVTNIRNNTENNNSLSS